MKTVHEEITSLVEQVGAKFGIPVSCLHAALHVQCVRMRGLRLCMHSMCTCGRLRQVFQCACMAVAECAYKYVLGLAHTCKYTFSVREAAIRLA